MSHSKRNTEYSWFSLSFSLRNIFIVAICKRFCYASQSFCWFSTLLASRMCCGHAVIQIKQFRQQFFFFFFIRFVWFDDIYVCVWYMQMRFHAIQTTWRIKFYFTILILLVKIEMVCALLLLFCISDSFAAHTGCVFMEIITLLGSTEHAKQKQKRKTCAGQFNCSQWFFNSRVCFLELSNLSHSARTCIPKLV